MALNGNGLKLSGSKELLAKLNSLSSVVETEVPDMVAERVDAWTAMANAEYMTAQYDGNNDVSVTFERPNKNTWHIVASGKSVLFIEYGSGIIFPHDSKFGDFASYGRKSWSVSSQGKGFLIGKRLDTWKGWWPLPKDVFGEHGWATAGNPSANVMYEISKDARYELPSSVQVKVRKALR